MSRRTITSLTLFLLSAGAVLGQPQPESASEICASAKRAAAAETARLSQPVWINAVEEVADETDVQHYALELEILPSTQLLRGTNEITVKSLVAGLDRFRFWLDESLSVDAVAVDGVAATWQRLDEATVEVPLPSPQPANGVFVVKVGYSGHPAPDGPGIYFEAHKGQPIVTTHSEPWFANLWWPVKEDNRDKATADITLVVPEGLTGLSNGLLVDQSAADGKARFHWRTAYPTSPYLFFVSVTNYNSFTDSVELQGHQMPLQFFILPEQDTPDNRAQWLFAKDLLKTFSDLFGLYPFVNEKYGIYNFAHGGMEHQTISGQTGFFLELTAHELSHQWWGDLVTCATWNDIWLNEGFATYSEALLLERQAGANGAGALKRAMDDRRPPNPNGAVYVWDASPGQPVFSDLTYKKGAWVLHMLRHLLGDQAFFSTLRRYETDHAYASVTTEDLRAAAEAVSGRDLRWFFEDWVYKGSVPSYELGWSQRVIDEQGFLELYVNQVQADGSAVRMLLPIRVVTLEGASDLWVFNDARTQHLLLPMEATVSSVTLDPDAWMLVTGNRQVPFVKAPPRIMALDPLPGAWYPEGALSELTVTFHEDVVAHVSDFKLVGNSAGDIPLDLHYSRASRTATLTPSRPLPADRYTFTIADSITATGGGQLDGELGRGPELLPSGNGVPGGTAFVHFSVEARPRRHLLPRH